MMFFPIYFVRYALKEEDLLSRDGGPIRRAHSRQNKGRLLRVPNIQIFTIMPINCLVADTHRFPLQRGFGARKGVNNR